MYAEDGSLLPVVSENASLIVLSALNRQIISRLQCCDDWLIRWKGSAESLENDR